jgi:hypothetical protein
MLLRLRNNRQYDSLREDTVDNDLQSRREAVTPEPACSGELSRHFFKLVD